MSFTVRADSYDRFMGRYSSPLATTFADFAGVVSGQRALDVGCGPGALTTELVERLGAAAVAAVDPSQPFIAAVQERHPGIFAQQAAAEELPFGEATFDAALAQLVVPFMADAVTGLREMVRVTRARGVVAACVWDHAGKRGPLTLFWQAARQLDPDVKDESRLVGAGQGQLVQLMHAAGIQDVHENFLSVDVEHPSFEDWWVPFTLGVGPAGAYTIGLDPKRRGELRELCRDLLPAPPFVMTAGAWAARGRAPSRR